MDISQQFLIDMALNVGGYVLAGLVGVVTYSMLHRRRRSTAPADVAPIEVPAPETTSQPTGETESRRIEFIKLGEHQSEATGRTAAESTPQTGANGERRDRSEIIRIARTMLKAGASDEKIKRLIPISDAELSLLSMSKS